MKYLIDTHIFQMNFETLELKADDAASLYHLPRTPHRDPFDRMIIWQAIREKMILIDYHRMETH